jgi:hypothetical protein
MGGVAPQQEHVGVLECLHRQPAIRFIQCRGLDADAAGILQRLGNLAVRLRGRPFLGAGVQTTSSSVVSIDATITTTIRIMVTHRFRTLGKSQPEYKPRRLYFQAT